MKQKSPQWQKRRWRKVVVFLSAVLSVSFSPPVISADKLTIKPKRVEQPKAMRGWCDIPPQNYTNLMPHYREVPDALNAVPLLLKAKEAIVGLDDMTRKLRNYQRGKITWDTEYWAKKIEQNQKAQQIIFQAAKKPWFQIPLSESPGSEITGLMAVLPILKFEQIHIIQAIENGQIEEAAKLLHLTMQISQKTMSADAGLIGYLVAVASYQQSLQMAEMVIGHPKCNLQHLKTIQKCLDEIPSPCARLQEAFRYEFRLSTKWMGDIYQGRLKYRDLFGGIERHGMDDRGFQLLARLAMQPNRTFKMHAEAMRYGILCAETPRWKRAKLPKPDVIKRLEKKPNRWAYLSTNGIGELFFDMTLPPILRQVEKLDAIETQIHSVQLLCALRNYHIVNGTLPKELKNLVPNVIQRIPIDPYDGKLLRYSREKKRIWSIGTDGKDEGGLDNVKPFSPFRKMEKEPTFFLRFAQT